MSHTSLSPPMARLQPIDDTTLARLTAQSQGGWARRIGPAFLLAPFALVALIALIGRIV